MEEKLQKMLSICNSNEETDLGTILIGANPFSLNYSTSSLNFTNFLQIKGNGGKPSRSETKTTYTR